jgi:hypothetical protein
MKCRSDLGRGWLPIVAIVLAVLILIDIIWPRKDRH